MVLIPGASFEMGSRSEEVAGALATCRAELGDECARSLYEREAPSRSVQVGPFFIDRREVTREAMGQERDAALPATAVTWAEARAHCRARGGDLPTEAQWELAARGPERRQFPWGDGSPTCEGVVYGRRPSAPFCPGPVGPAPVGAAATDRTPEGVEDLAGNVAEWVRDAFTGAYAPCPEPCADPFVDGGSGAARVVRGGYFSGAVESLRAAGRSRRPPDDRFDDLGFRCVVEPPR
jgi:serine/threonine-protein kinase